MFWVHFRLCFPFTFFSDLYSCGKEFTFLVLADKLLTSSIYGADRAMAMVDELTLMGLGIDS